MTMPYRHVPPTEKQHVTELERWAWSGNPTVSLDWGFHFASGTTPSGTLSLQLPLK
jgi:hypothetical protein